MRSYCVNKHEATEPEYPRVLKITAPKLKLSTQLLLKMSTVRNLFFSFVKMHNCGDRKKGRGVPQRL